MYKREVELNLNDLLNSGGVSPEEYFFWKGMDNRTVYITDEIDENCVYNSLLPLKRLDDDGSLEPITIYLNTPGGHVYVGMALANVIENLKCPTRLVVLGYALSMGAVILAAAAGNPNVTIECNKFSVGLIHCGNEILQGTANQNKDKMEFNNKYDAMLDEYLMERLNITEEEYAKMQRYEWWLTSDDMLRLGMVDKVV